MSRVYSRPARARVIAAAMCAISTMAPAFAFADGLRVTPVRLEVTAPQAATVLTLKNEGRQSITVQSRIFSWRQSKGRERLERTSTVVASPPMVRIAPGAEQTVRIVRTSKSRIRGEEAYRLYIDEVPDRARVGSGVVNIVTRLRIPVFFSHPGSRRDAVRWSIRQRGGRSVLIAQNTGDTYLRVQDMTLQKGGITVYRHKGLLGYVLGRGTMEWPVQATLRGPMKLNANTNRGKQVASVGAR